MVCGMTAATTLANAADGRPPTAAIPQEPDASRVCPHVRASDTTATRLLGDGMRLSPTFRHLVETLEKSDVIAWVETRPIALPGPVMLVAATGGWRHVRITIRRPGLDGELIAWLAHELQHAVEIARAPDVRTQDALRRLYERIGSGPRSEDLVESEEAEEIWLRVRHEIDDARNAANRK